MVPIADGESSVQILFNQQNGKPFVLQPAYDLDDLAHNERRQALRWLIQKHQRWIQHERTSDGQHLLLAAGKLKAAITVASLQYGEKLVDSVESSSGWISWYARKP